MLQFDDYGGTQMGQYLDMMLAGAKRARLYAEKLAVGIKPEQAGRKPHFEAGGAPVMVDTNHPLFIFGHLALYPARIMKFAGLDGAACAAPAGWDDLFKAGVPCHDDPEGKIYPKWDVVLAQYYKGTDLMIAALEKADDKVLTAPTPDEKMRERFPLAGAAITFMLNNHVMMHMGQVSVWRRCFGLPSAM
jgi:DinB superfamily